MILCHKYKFIFIKTSKTAGSSVEIALSKFCGENDIVTPMFHAPDEAIRNKLGHVKPQNYKLPISNSRDIHPLKLLAYQRSPAFTNHMSAKDIRRYVGEDIWNSYYKSCEIPGTEQPLYTTG